MPLTLGELADVKMRDPYIYSVFKRIVDHINLIERQSGFAPLGQIPAPPTISGLSVVASNGWFDIQIQDNGSIQPGIEYFVEYDTTPNFTNARVFSMGPSRNHVLNLGNQTLYWRAYSQYRGSTTSAKITFGSPPTGVAGGGATSPPAPQASQGSGTSLIPGNGFGTPPNVATGHRTS